MSLAAQTVTWGDVAMDAARRLGDAGVADAQMQARRMVEQASGFEGGEYYVGLTQGASRRQLAHLDSMLVRRLAGEPLQYVLGRWGFRGLDLMVSPAVLIPRPETETLAGLAVAELSRRHLPGGLVVDLGTGSGAVGLAVAAECDTARVVLTDASAEALAVARANLAGLGRAAVRVSACQGSWYEALPGSMLGTVDVVVSNPPYVRDDEELSPEVAEWEPAMALRGGADGLDGARQILADARRWLSPGGSVLLELAPDQMEAAGAMARAGGLVLDAVHPDLAGRDRVLHCRRP
ncbi:MAG: peptide chain release factor N(5)-glutamine methyltransferase [Acidimicrobiia bacterium]|nr:peptide chain release factor N(5)-glutamine methyltransferase [Acidimicrobiia bacterium]MYG72034.1 peptide chain release factor N(5)-glutamine methyltransferase [Acidimicrobiia bacterium]